MGPRRALCGRHAYRERVPPRPPSVLIIGAGFGGLGLGILLARARIHSFTILEKATSLGGTWRDNRYPGAACDVPSHMYCYSFAPKPDWSRKWAPQTEILQYMQDLAADSGVAGHIEYGVEVATAQWQPQTSEWLVTTTDGRMVRADILVSAVGQLHHPALPDIPGLDTFAGPAVHASNWPDDLDLTGRQVGVIGTAASAVQVVPAIAGQVSRLTVFQRSPNWILPRGDRPYRDWEKRLFGSTPSVMRAYRTWIWANYEARFPALRGNRVATAMARRLLDRHLNEAIPDDDLRHRLTPDYPVGARRVLSSDDYYPALLRDNVDLVTEPVVGVDAEGVELADGRHVPLDALVMATGFRSTHFLAPMQITGRDGRRLTDDWSDGAHAYLGLSVPGYPNLFLLYGPNTNLGHNSILFMLECQARHVVACVKSMQHGDTIEVRDDVHESFNRDLQGALQRTVWGSVDRSWYKNEAGRITNNWGYGTPRYWWHTRRSPSYAYTRTRAEASRG